MSEIVHESPQIKNRIEFGLSPGEHGHEPPFKTFFFRTPADYLKTWEASDCTVETDTLPVGKWIMRGWLPRRDFARIIAAFDRVGGLFIV